MKHIWVQIVSIVLSLIILSSLANAANVRTVQVNALSWVTLTYNLDSGQAFSGSLSITGGGNDIDFWVTNPEGTTILGLGRITQGKSFEFTAQKNGAYVLHFDNSFSWFTAKTVTLTYSIGTPTVFGFDPLTLMMTVAFIAALVILGAFVYVQQRKKRTTQTPPPSSQ
jgi:hypothetical protein